MLEEQNWMLLFTNLEAGANGARCHQGISVFSTGGVFLKNFLARAPCRWLVAGVEELTGAAEFS